MSRTLFTSRFGGDLTLASHREILKRNLSLSTLHFMRQTHSDIVQIVDESGENFPCDALVSRSTGVGLAALAADCMPITFTSAGVIAVAHVGRVGVINGIVKSVVTTMQGLGAQAISATIGPSICANCYAVSDEMYREVVSQIPETATTPGRRSLNLQGGVSAQLEKLEVTVHNLEICTLERHGYYSYRGGDATARQVGVISQ